MSSRTHYLYMEFLDGARSTIRQQLGSAQRARFGVRAYFRLRGRGVDVPWVEVFVGAKQKIYVTPLPIDKLRSLFWQPQERSDGTLPPNFAVCVERFLF